jgi:hypothetical protein
MDKHLLLLARCLLCRADRRRYPNVIVGGTAFAERGALLLGLNEEDRHLLQGMGSGRYNLDAIGPAVRELNGSFATFVAPAPLGCFLKTNGCSQDPMGIFDREPYLVLARHARNSLAEFRGRWHNENRVTAIIAEADQRVRFLVHHAGLHFDPDQAQTISVQITLRSVPLPLQVVTAMPDTAT